MKPSSRIIAMGVIMALLGALALAFASATTLAAVLFLGGLLFVAGVAQIAYAIQGRKAGELWPHLGIGILAIACAVLIVNNPIENILGLTLAVGFLLVATGLTKLVSAVLERSVGWVWVAASGVVSLLLAAIILTSFPASAFWTIGTFVGVDLLFSGLSFIGMGASMKQMRKNLEKTFASSTDIERENERYLYQKQNRKDKSEPTIHH